MIIKNIIYKYTNKKIKKFKNSVLKILIQLIYIDFSFLKPTIKLTEPVFLIFITIWTNQSLNKKKYKLSLIIHSSTQNIHIQHGVVYYYRKNESINIFLK